MFCTPTQNRQDNILREETKQTSMIDSLNPALETRRRNTTHKNHKRVKKNTVHKRRNNESTSAQGILCISVPFRNVHDYSNRGDI